MIVDASVVVAMLAPDAEDTERIEQVWDIWALRGERLLAPSVLRLEVSNALLTGIRRGRWTGVAADEAAARTMRLPIAFRDAARDRERAWELSRRYDNHPGYDMVYVALAERLGERLVTLDERLRRRFGHVGFVVGPEDVLDR